MAKWAPFGANKDKYNPNQDQDNHNKDYKNNKATKTIIHKYNDYYLIQRMSINVYGWSFCSQNYKEHLETMRQYRTVP